MSRQGGARAGGLGMRRKVERLGPGVLEDVAQVAPNFAEYIIGRRWRGIDPLGTIPD